ncbi:MAG TPA: ABC transporter permease [Stackebrandtia sp.]|jgi:peptide/nickel transport system permease protein|uniref:ABC transporter permease n=1 Tax=Stackebrandtia sp. TaxID=2023065 RepID=UPI002D5280C4|nr:ABC transporter permease [Stackebrandtia sp.]HZE40985.1 ABC transporter permease [Stackebrandtia sp.]
MLRFVVRRVLLAVLTLFAVSVITFTLFFAVPSDPAQLMCSKDCTHEQIEQTRDALGLNDPIVTQYTDYMTGIFVGRDIGKGEAKVRCDAPCFGYSYRDNESVWSNIKDAAPITLSIAVGAWIIQTLLGITIGVIAALRRGSVIDKVAVGSTLIGASMPVYFFSAILLLVFVYTTNIIPRPVYTPLLDNPAKWALGMLLPWLSLALIGYANEARMTRATMLETLSEDFVRTAKAKGVPKGQVHRRHALRASITPVITISGMNLGYLMGGAVITETVFGLPGLGKLSVDAVSTLNLPIVMATVLIAALAIVIMTMVVDFLYAVIDPRVRLS